MILCFLLSKRNMSWIWYCLFHIFCAFTYRQLFRYIFSFKMLFLVFIWWVLFCNFSTFLNCNFAIYLLFHLISFLFRFICTFDCFFWFIIFLLGRPIFIRFLLFCLKTILNYFSFFKTILLFVWFLYFEVRYLQQVFIRNFFSMLKTMIISNINKMGLFWYNLWMMFDYMPILLWILFVFTIVIYFKLLMINFGILYYNCQISMILMLCQNLVFNIYFNTLILRFMKTKGLDVFKQDKYDQNKRFHYLLYFIEKLTK